MCIRDRVWVVRKMYHPTVQQPSPTLNFVGDKFYGQYNSRLLSWLWAVVIYHNYRNPLNRFGSLSSTLAQLGWFLLSSLKRSKVLERLINVLPRESSRSGQLELGSRKSIRISKRRCNGGDLDWAGERSKTGAFSMDKRGSKARHKRTRELRRDGRLRQLSGKMELQGVLL